MTPNEMDDLWERVGPFCPPEVTREAFEAVTAILQALDTPEKVLRQRRGAGSQGRCAVSRLRDYARAILDAEIVLVRGAVAALRDREADKAEIRRLGIARQLYRDSALRAWAAASAAHQERDTARAELTPMVCGHLPREMHPQDRACAACHALAEEERGAATIERLRGERDAARAEAERMSADLRAIDSDGKLREALRAHAKPAAAPEACYYCGKPAPEGYTLDDVLPLCRACHIPSGPTVAEIRAHLATRAP